jgi:hypothetical protein
MQRSWETDLPGVIRNGGSLVVWRLLSQVDCFLVFDRTPEVRFE